MKFKLQKNRAEVLAMARDAVKPAPRTTPPTWSSAPRTPPAATWASSPKSSPRPWREGATVINIPDTVGYTVPGEYGEILRTLRRRVPALEQAVLSVHCHNDLGLGVANSLAAIEAGARQVECTVNGIGERAGNASLEEVVMALRVRRDALGFDTRIATQEIYRTSQLLSNITGVQVQPNKAVVGRNAFAHEAGIHQHGVMASPTTYEIMTPDSVGVKTSSLVLGKHSGRHALDQRFRDLGFDLEPEALAQAYLLFTRLADQKKEIFDEDLVALVNDGLTGRRRAPTSCGRCRPPPAPTRWPPPW